MLAQCEKGQLDVGSINEYGKNKIKWLTHVLIRPIYWGDNQITYDYSLTKLFLVFTIYEKRLPINWSFLIFIDGVVFMVLKEFYLVALIACKPIMIDYSILL